jgi:hypothetical protein
MAVEPTNAQIDRNAVRRFDAALTVEGLFADVRYALRQLMRNRGFTAIAILTLALGIGATTGIFSILNAWIIQPLPLKAPQRLVILWRAHPAIPVNRHTTSIGATMCSSESVAIASNRSELRSSADMP